VEWNAGHMQGAVLLPWRELQDKPDEKKIRGSDIPSVRDRIDGNRKAGVNPTAVFYTDHPEVQ